MASPLTSALIEHLVRTGIFDADDIAAIADALDRDGHAGDAHLTRAAFVEASAPDQIEWERDQRRGQLRVVPDGGNPTE